MIKYNIYPEFENKREAEIVVRNLGLANWDWQPSEFSNEEISDKLVNFLFIKADGMTSLEELLSRFIKTQLHLNPRDFSLNDPMEEKGNNMLDDKLKKIVEKANSLKVGLKENLVVDDIELLIKKLIKDIQSGKNVDQRSLSEFSDGELLAQFLIPMFQGVTMGLTDRKGFLKTFTSNL